jgi:lipid A 3-O-deacylase
MRARYLIGWTAMTLLLCGAAVPALAGGVVEELKLGILDHDVPDLWSGFRAEPDSVDINIEALLSPSAPFLGGTVRPALGGTINTVGATSHAYIDARWQYEMPSGVFFGLGIGGPVGSCSSRTRI